jgi:hypothetical protein
MDVSASVRHAVRKLKRKAHERRLRGSMEPRLRGETSQGMKVKRASVFRIV